MFRWVLKISLLFLLLGCSLAGSDSNRNAKGSEPAGVREWRHYGGDLGSSRYSALDQINRSNVSRLKVAWTYHTGEKRYSSPRSANVRNPRTQPADIAEGKKLYQTLCTTCHTTGGAGPDLTHHELRRANSDAGLFSTIFDGIPNSPMPGLFESEERVWQVVAYVRTLLPMQGRNVPSETEDTGAVLGWEQKARYSVMECTPIEKDGVMYIVTLFSKVHALEAATGKALWTFDPFGDDQFHGLKRAVTYWEYGEDRRIYFVGGPRLYALNAKTGKPIPSFGDNGSIDLTKGYDREVTYASYNSPPVIYKNLIILGSAYYASGEPKQQAKAVRKPPPGDIRAYDIHNGKRAWIFHTIPHPGEFGYDTWPPDAWKTAHGANSWGGMTVDERRGLLFAGTAAAYYDPPRYGQNLFANTLLVLQAETGKRVWHYQTIHHDVWDLDIPCPPNLVTVERGGRRIDAVAQAGKTGLTFIFDRESGKPFFPIEERPVETGDWPGEKLWPTQPFPLKPPPITRAKFEITDISPEARASVLEKLKAFRYGRYYEPFEKGKGTILYPGGVTGGVDYGGASYDPTTGWLYLNSNDIPWIFHGPGGGGQLLDHEGFPGVKPPWGKLTALNLSKGEIAWQVPLGEYEELSRRGTPPTGTENLGGTIVTAGGLVFVGAAQDAKLRAFDKTTGRLLWQTDLPAVASATPSTYEVNGKQYLVIAAGGGGGMQQVHMLDSAGPFRSHRQRLQPGDAIIAFALPD